MLQHHLDAICLLVLQGLSVFALCVHVCVCTYLLYDFLQANCTKYQHRLEPGSGPTSKNAAAYSSQSGKLVSCCFQKSGITF